MLRALFLLFVFMCSVAQIFSQEQQFNIELLSEPRRFSKEIEEIFDLNEIEVYERDVESNAVLLENGYARSIIKNVSDWNAKDTTVVIVEINLIYSKYPVDRDLWRTDYYDLLAQRLMALFNVDPRFNSKEISWGILLQTKCTSESQAQGLFHGFEIIYEKKETVAPSAEKPSIPVVKLTAEERKIKTEKRTSKQGIKRFARSIGGVNDSTVIRVFNKHPEWNNALLVMDWTGSMYQYGTQALDWHVQNYDSSGIKYFVFFNDGDQSTKKKYGKTGGIYGEAANELKSLTRLLKTVRTNGMGGDFPENNIEALVKGTLMYPEYSEIIMIADNKSCVRDYCCLKNLKDPVKVLLCGTHLGINPQYINIAYRTGGSLHAKDVEIVDFTSAKAAGTLTIGDETFNYNPSRDLFEYSNGYPKNLYEDCTPFEDIECRCKISID